MSRFLYPRSRQFPMDAVCEEIVRELEKRKFDVNNIVVAFNWIKTESDEWKYVSHITGPDFRLWFCRVQGSLGCGWMDAAAVCELIIPGKELHVCTDESGPSLFVHVGKEPWSFKGKQNSKINKQPRTYLKYKGAFPTDWAYGLTRAPILKHDNEHGREYDLEPGDPELYRTQDIMDEFTSYLRNHVLQMVLGNRSLLTDISVISNRCVDDLIAKISQITATCQLEKTTFKLRHIQTGVISDWYNGFDQELYQTVAETTKLLDKSAMIKHANRKGFDLHSVPANLPGHEVFFLSISV